MRIAAKVISKNLGIFGEYFQKLVLMLFIEVSLYFNNVRYVHFLIHSVIIINVFAIEVIADRKSSSTSIGACC